MSDFRSAPAWRASGVGLRTIILSLGALASMSLGAVRAQPENDTDRAATLIAMFAERLAVESPGQSIEVADFELERAGNDLLPRVSLHQQAGWRPGGLPHGSLGASLTMPLTRDGPALTVELALVRHELALHNSRSERQSRLLEFVRAVRVLAHLEEVEVLLQGGEALGTPATLDEQIARLELERALLRTSAELQLLRETIARDLPAGTDLLAQGQVGRPPLELPDGSFEEVCRGDSDETLRAALVLEEERLMGAIQQLSSEATIDLEARGDLRYQPLGPAGGFDPWQAEASLGLTVRLPLTAADASLSVSGGGAGISQSASLRFPAQPVPTSPTLEGADERYDDALAEARRAARQAWLLWEDAQRSIEVRRLELLALESRLTPSNPVMETAILQARLGLLSAELSADLALLDLFAPCGWQYAI